MREAAAEVGESTATLTAARTVRGYTEIRASKPGKVIQRAVSPGVLASPGMLILRVAQIDRVRLQAYVTEKDLKWMRVGDPVEACHPRLPGGALSARITSVFPASDPATHTAIVEALVTNPREVLAPGDAVTLKITTHPREDVITVPSSAIVYRTVVGTGPSRGQEATVWLAGRGEARQAEYTCPMHPEVRSDQPGACPKCKMDLVQVPGTGGEEKSAETYYTCSMHPEIRSDKPGLCPKCKMELVPATAAGQAGVKNAQQVVVTLGASDGERTEIISGLQAGNVIVVRGQTNLRDGDLVFPVPWTARGPAELPPAAGASPPAAGEQKAAPAGHESMPGMKMSAPLQLDPLARLRLPLPLLLALLGPRGGL